MTSEDLLKDLYRRVIADPKIRAAAANRLEFAAEPQEGSYFLPVECPHPVRADMETAPGSDELDALERIWTAADSGLAGHVSELRSIAELIASEREDAQSAPKLSDYVYQMW